MPQALLDAIAAVIGLLTSHLNAHNGQGLQTAIDAVSRVLGV